MLEKHIKASAKLALTLPEVLAGYESAIQTPQALARLRSSRTPKALRLAVSDYDIMKIKKFSMSSLRDTPKGWFDVSIYEKYAALALWKIAESLDHSGNQQLQLILEGFAAGKTAAGFDEYDYELQRTCMKVAEVEKDTTFSLIKAKTEETRQVKSEAAKKGHAALWGECKAKSLELANQKTFKSYSEAAEHIQPIIDAELHRCVKHRTIEKWLSKKGWKPTKPISMRKLRYG
jgi:hypothetical protein